MRTHGSLTNHVDRRFQLVAVGTRNMEHFFRGGSRPQIGRRHGAWLEPRHRVGKPRRGGISAPRGSSSSIEANSACCDSNGTLAAGATDWAECSIVGMMKAIPHWGHSHCMPMCLLHPARGALADIRIERSLPRCPTAATSVHFFTSLLPATRQRDLPGQGRKFPRPPIPDIRHVMPTICRMIRHRSPLCYHGPRIDGYSSMACW